MDAAVICSQLGFDDAYPMPVSRQLFDNNEAEKSGYFVLEFVNCYGNESTIGECPNSGWGSKNSTFQSMSCIDFLASSIWCAPTSPKVRLLGGRGDWEGNVEVEGFGDWGYMCNPFQKRDGPFDKERLNNVAKVICGQLGYNPEDATILYGNYFDVKGSEHFKCNKCLDKHITPLIMSELHCDGTESTLFDCKYTRTDLLCRHDKALAVSCKKEPIKLRLEGGDSSTMGRLEVYGFGFWSPVCGYKFTDQAAAVVCNQLDINPNNDRSKPVWLPSHRFFGTSSDRMRLTGVSCSGTEARLSECEGFTLGRPHYNLIADFWVKCREKDQVGIDCNPSPVKARLVDGPNERSGRVELYYAGKWGTICGTYFSSISAKIVCEMLGFRNRGGDDTNAILHKKSEFGKGDLDLIMQFAIFCDEERLTFESCGSIYWESNGWCLSRIAPVAGVTCATKKECVANNVLYSHRQIMPAPDNCKRCKCRKGRQVCTTKKTKKCRDQQSQ
ncbi:unnamed protein product [Owenia fusiformis]|uniref:Uncharacterized protein n=1 Tax=Owenia fusiformis TaxID=6347 RepID=A0A8J1T5W1_OWEFU|nr:unnamed protein product [Owenia fusiformis]